MRGIFQVRKVEQESFIFLVVLPILNALMMSTVNFFKGSLPAGEIRAAIISLFLIYFISRRFPNSKANRVVVLFVIYVLLAGLHTYISFGFFNVVVFRIIIATLFFSVGYYYVTSFERFVLLNKAYVISLAIIILIIGISNIFNLEVRQVYVDVDINFGAQGVNTTKILALYILLYPLQEVVLSGSKYGKILLPMIIISMILVFIGLKRGAVAGLLAGSIVMILMGGIRGRTMKRLLYIVVILALTTPLYYPKVVKMYEAREHQLKLYEDDQYKEEARFNEAERTLEDMKGKGILPILFGEGIGSEMHYFGTNRMIHTDYISILFGGGVVGLIIYISSYIVILVEQKKYHRVLKEIHIFSLIRKVSISLLVCAAFLAFSGLYHTIDLRAVLLLYLGSSLGLTRSYLKSLT